MTWRDYPFRVLWITPVTVGRLVGCVCSERRFAHFPPAWRLFQRTVASHGPGRVQIQQAAPERLALGAVGFLMYDGEPVVRPTWRVLADHWGKA